MSSVKKTLIVTGMKPITTVQTKSGGTSTLYEVYATKPDGSPVEEALRAFTELEEGQPIEYDVSRYDHPQHGTSFTLTPPRSKTRERLRALEDQMAGLMAWAKDAGYEPPEPPKPDNATPAPESADLDERFGADPPEGFGDPE